MRDIYEFIHLNSLRAGLAEDLSALDRYSWCGHSNGSIMVEWIPLRFIKKAQLQLLG